MFQIAMPLLITLAVMSASPPVPADLPDSTERSTPYGGNSHAIPGLLEAEHYDDGAPGVAYHDVDEENLGAPYRRDTQVDIERRKDASNGHGIGWTRAGEWLHYTVEVKEAGFYRVTFPVASNQKGGTFHLEIDGKDITGQVQVPDTGGWDKLEVIAMEKVELQAGSFVLRMVMDKVGASGSIGDIDYIKFVKLPAE